LKDLYEKEYSEIYEYFYGMTQTFISSVNPQHTVLSIKTEMNFIIHFPIMKPIHLTDCFNEFIQAELLDGDNQWYNGETNLKETVHKQSYFWKLPDILFIVLMQMNLPQRFQVDCPFELNLNRYVIGYERNNVYDLYGMCMHHGSSRGGHYLSCVKHLQTSNWFQADDENVQMLQQAPNMVPDSTYLLAYRRKKEC
jgi:ubiquitin C-terminal hydrolase